MTATGPIRGRAAGVPDRTVRLSAWRRIRVVRWSSANRSASAAGLAACCSSVSMMRSWRSSSDWFRRPRLVSTCRKPPRSRASAAAAAAAVSCMLASAAVMAANSATLEGRDGPGACRVTATAPPAPSRSRATVPGSCSSAR